MDKKIIKRIVLLVIFILLTVFVGIIIFFQNSEYGRKLYDYNNYNGVLDSGEELSIYQILGDNIDKTKYREFEKYRYKKADVKSYGSTAHMRYEIDNNVIEYIGNRNLVEINGVLYVYIE